MNDQPDPAHVLFPGDAPKEPPAWFDAQKAGAEARLMGSQKREAEQQQHPAKVEPDANVLFPSERKGPDYAGIVESEFESPMNDALLAKDEGRIEELKEATTALSKNFADAGSDANDIKEAFQLIRESAPLGTLTEEARQRSFDRGMEAVKDAGISDADLSAARAFINDLQIVNPNVRHQLEAGGAGNDIRMIQLAVREARRRGYGK
ncbi:hypothetical protein [Mesorhizobium sp. GR13]|uniref:hypothetical protein n=1 Tax=Mesorhizobium sp. GR13 TaxID=2562308 RepID=UPI0010BFC7AB|nr:hypothetical protein [Mesorhizobium sp. GR13]